MFSTERVTTMRRASYIDKSFDNVVQKVKQNEGRKMLKILEKNNEKATDLTTYQRDKKTEYKNSVADFKKRI